MKNNYPIIIEIVSAIEILCRQVNTMMTITGRSCPNEQLQSLINARVEEFKMLYSEIPKNSYFEVETLKDGLLFIRSNQVFRDYAEQIEKLQKLQINETLH